MSIVDYLYNEYERIVSFLNENGQPSLASDANKYFKKVILLSSASYFEHEIQDIIVSYVESSTNNNIKVINLLKKKAISSNYHTFFSWGEKNDPNKPGKNANVFFSMFGDDFKVEVQNDIKDNEALDKSIKSFLEIGHLRNILVHSNFAAYNLDNKTPDEIYNLHKQSEMFINFVRTKLS
ncbi:MAG TPA: hypothetical protein ENJ51_10255 [Leucothrix mucor]|uniref:RiboL-PSP-HEPN domain-containing protein n=1 Tax=Leucothrix mucor TaxID=45248 RepID=A0A7V2T117_LEUMU|nr:hypothetical protein [Leucothrix mucor]